MAEQIPENEFGKEYSEKNFWDKVKRYAIKAGKSVILNALTMYYTINDGEREFSHKNECKSLFIKEVVLEG